MEEKYYPLFKNYSEFHKLLLKNDLITKLCGSYTAQDSNETPELLSPSQNDDELDSPLNGHLIETIDEETIQNCKFDLSPNDQFSSKQIGSGDDPMTTKLSALITSTGINLFFLKSRILKH